MATTEKEESKKESEFGKTASEEGQVYQIAEVRDIDDDCLLFWKSVNWCTTANFKRPLVGLINEIST